MSNVMEVINSREKKRDFKLIMVLSFVLVAISFFVVGFIYASVPQSNVLIPVFTILGGINSLVVFYLYKKYDRVENTDDN